MVAGCRLHDGVAAEALGVRGVAPLAFCRRIVTPTKYARHARKTRRHIQKRRATARRYPHREPRVNSIYQQQKPRAWLT